MATGNRRATAIKLVATVALVVLAGALVLNRRYETRTEYGDHPVAWSHFDVSADGRTLSFVGRYGSVCDEPGRVELERVSESSITATAYYERLERRGGERVFCPLAGVIGLRTVTVTMDEPLPDGTLVVDGTSTPRRPEGCPRSEQRIGDPPDPTVLGDLPAACLTIQSSYEPTGD